MGEACGFADSCDAVRMRWIEDGAALRELGARALHLPFCDAQYGTSPSAPSLGVALAAVFRAWRPETVALPLGLFHSDHVLVRCATLLAHRRMFGARPRLVAYEDAFYRGMQHQRGQALRDMLDQQFQPLPHRHLVPRDFYAVFRLGVADQRDSHGDPEFCGGPGKCLQKTIRGEGVVGDLLVE